MKKKVICILVCTVLLSIAVTAPATSIKTTNPTPDDIKYLEICVFREENEELVPVHRAEVYVYVYPKKIPQFGMTFTDGYLLFQPTVRIGDDVKITAYHEWYGGNTVMYSVDEQDPDVIHYDIILDPTKSVSRNRFESIQLPYLLQKLLTLISLKYSIL